MPCSPGRLRYHRGQMRITSSLTIATLALALGSTACDDGKKKDEPSKAATKKADPAEGDAKKAEAPAAAGRVFFVKPADGATVSESFEVEFGVEGKQIRPAGATERDPKFGHHHLIIDEGPIADMTVVPKDETHIHYGDGSTKDTVKLAPGKHTLTMQLADGAHRSYGEDWAATISVEVKADAEGGAAPEGGEAAPGAEAAAEGAG